MPNRYVKVTDIIACLQEKQYDLLPPDLSVGSLSGKEKIRFKAFDEAEVCVKRLPSVKVTHCHECQYSSEDGSYPSMNDIEGYLNCRKWCTASSHKAVVVPKDGYCFAGIPKELVDSTVRRVKEVRK